MNNAKVLVCVSGMPQAAPTLKFVNLMAALGASKATLLTVVERVGDETAAYAMLEQVKELVAVPVKTTKVRQGESVKEIIEEVHEDGSYDVIVVGSRVVSGLAHLFLRSVSLKVTDRAPISVFVVKEEQPSLERILICTGGQQLNPAVVTWGASLAKAAGASVKLLYVANPVPGMYTGLEDMDETVSELLQSNTPVAQHLRRGSQYLAVNGVPAEIKVRHGVAADEILREANQGQYDLVVIGARADKSLLNELLMDKVTPYIVDHSPCSVLVVRRSP